jgi:transketolase
MARKLRNETGRVWVFMSDGEFQPGQTWEAIQTMVYHHLDNIGVYVDVNGQQCDGIVEQVMSIEPLHQKLKYFGARVFRVDGHDIKALVKPAGLKPNGHPLIVLADTNPCQGMEILKQRAPKLHYVRFEKEAERLQFQTWYDNQLSAEVI